MAHYSFLAGRRREDRSKTFIIVRREAQATTQVHFYLLVHQRDFHYAWIMFIYINQKCPRNSHPRNLLQDHCHPLMERGKQPLDTAAPARTSESARFSLLTNDLWPIPPRKVSVLHSKDLRKILNESIASRRLSTVTHESLMENITAQNVYLK